MATIKYACVFPSRLGKPAYPFSSKAQALSVGEALSHVYGAVKVYALHATTIETLAVFTVAP